MNPFAKSQIGYYLMGMDPITPLADIIICQQTDAQVGRISELMEYLKLPIFKIGVPPDWEKDYAFDYYFKSICKLKIKLEQITGNKITEVKLRKYILLINKVNDILYKISELRKFDSPLIGGYNFILINHIYNRSYKKYINIVIKVK